MINFPFSNKLHHLLIRSRWRRWLFPVACAVPYISSIIWLVSIDQLWIAQILLAPLVMTFLLAILTFLLARLEFRR